MSGTGECTADFAGEERAFRIRLGEIRRIEAKCVARIGEVARRLSRSLLVLEKHQGAEAIAVGLEIGADDVREPILQGLIGGGMPAPAATRLVREAIDDRGLRGLLDHVGTALEVIWGTQKVPDVGETMAEATTKATPPQT